MLDMKKRKGSWVCSECGVVTAVVGRVDMGYIGLLGVILIGIAAGMLMDVSMEYSATIFVIGVVLNILFYLVWWKVKMEDVRVDLGEVR